VERKGTVVKVQLPDNVTMFKVRAKAVHGAERFGSAKGAVAVRLPVVVQPAFPRFVRPGDAFDAVAIGRIVEGRGGAGTAEIRAEGLTLQGPAKIDLEWNKHRAERIAFPVIVPTPPLSEDGTLAEAAVTIQVGVSRHADKARDAFEVTLPLRDDRRVIHERLVAELEAEVPFVVPPIEEAIRPGSLRRSLVVADHPGLVKMSAGLDFLRNMHLENTEHRLSQARTYLALSSFRSQLGQYEGREELDKAVTDTLEWLPQVVDHQTGLVSNWPGSRGYVSMTAWALKFTIEAAEAGFVIDEGMQDEFARALQRALRSDYAYFLDGESWYERVLALDALAATGDFSQSYFSELGRNAKYLDHESIAQVVLTADRAGLAKAAITQELATELVDGVIVQLYQGKDTYGGLTQRHNYRNPLILPGEARTLAHMARALARTKSEEPRLELMVDALVRLGKEDGWGHANANSAALFALIDFLNNRQGPEAVVTVTEGSESDSLNFGPQHGVALRTSTTAGPMDVTLSKGAEGAIMVSTRYLPD
ncbi:MAG: hypothetical protein HN348_31590, partial [Proteobacteria bacterium]|nr:hypothetical protein [Pseudomonadota bacterium]